LVATRRPAGRRGEAPVVLERYRLERQLGAGGFGTVWMARDERLEREVAVKIVPRERIVGGRFEREARAAARLAHPGIVTLYEAGADDDGAYLVSELVRGSTLGDLLEAGRLSDREIVGIGIALCDALAHAHAQDVVHRDVKPSNVLVPDRPSNPASVAKLTDFGVARIVGGDTLTRTGDVVGTAAYMAPEQAEGREAGPEADLYALALVLYEAFTGVNPVRAGTAAQRARRLGAHLPPLRRQRRDLPRELGQAIDLALRPRARERRTLTDLRHALATVSDHVSDAPGVVGPAWRPGRLGDADGAVAKNHSPPLDFRHDHASARPAADPNAREDPRTDPSEAPNQDPSANQPPTRWPQRALAALATAALTAWLTTHLLPSSPPVACLAAALIAATLVAALPRLGWLASAGALAVWLAAAGEAGAALVIALGALVTPLLAPWRPTIWGLPAGAPALGVLGLAGAWPALAGRARGALTRAALGAAGWVWTLLATAISGTNLYLRAPPSELTPERANHSIDLTLSHVLRPLLTSGALAPAVVWAGAAVILPWLVRGRSAAVDFVLASAWAAGLVAATYAALRTVHGPLAGATLRDAVLGGLAGFAIALAPSIRRTFRARRVFARVP
jgi:serine/threonine protein kinase